MSCALKERFQEEFLDIPLPVLYARLRWISRRPGAPVTSYETNRGPRIQYVGKSR